MNQLIDITYLWFNNLFFMALIQCPACGGTCSDQATKCPHCGCTINQKASPKVESLETISKNKLMIIALYCIAQPLILIIIGIGLLTTRNSSGSFSSSSSAYQSRQSYEQQVDEETKEYLEGKRLASAADVARDNYLMELSKLNQKIYQAQYQGVLRQRLFWDCDDAFNSYESKVNDLVRFLKKHGKAHEALALEEQIKQARSSYNDLKLSTQGY